MERWVYKIYLYYFNHTTINNLAIIWSNMFSEYSVSYNGDGYWNHYKGTKTLQEFIDEKKRVNL